MRATQHSGRRGGGRHNDRDFDVNKAKHIDPRLTPENSYICIYKDMNFADAERRFYAEHFTDMIADVNRRAELSRHPERKTDADKLVESKKTMPEEVILQIGNRKTRDAIERGELVSTFNDFFRWHEKMFGSHVKTLNIALHVDEKNGSMHFHWRRVWTYKHPDGYLAIGQHKALEQLGYQLPDKNEPRGRNNNLKMPYTAECREKWLDICHEHGFMVEREPDRERLADEKHLEKNDFILYEQNREIKRRTETLADLQSDVDAMKDVHRDTSVLLQSAKEELEQVKGEILSAEQARAFKVRKRLLGGKCYIKGTPSELANLLATAKRVERCDKAEDEARDVISRKNMIFDNANEKAERIINDATEKAEQIINDAETKARSTSGIMENATIKSKLMKYEKLEEQFPERFAQMRSIPHRTKTKDRLPGE